MARFEIPEVLRKFVLRARHRGKRCSVAPYSVTETSDQTHGDPVPKLITCEDWDRKMAEIIGDEVCKRNGWDQGKYTFLYTLTYEDILRHHGFTVPDAKQDSDSEGRVQTLEGDPELLQKFAITMADKCGLGYSPGTLPPTPNGNPRPGCTCSTT